MDKVLLSVVLAIAGMSLSCSPVWYFSIRAVTPELTPEFCISSKPNCRGKPVSLKLFFVSRVEPITTHPGVRGTGRLVWGIENREGLPLDRLIYGAVPPGWFAEVEATPLSLDQTYSVGPYWFTLRKDGETISWDIERANSLAAPVKD